MELYTLIEKGFDEDGSWARYLDSVGRECRMDVRRGLDVEEEILDFETEHHEELRWWRTLSRDEQDRFVKEDMERMARFEERDALGARLANGEFDSYSPEEWEALQRAKRAAALQDSKQRAGVWPALRNWIVSMLGLPAARDAAKPVSAKPAQPVAAGAPEH